MVKTKQKGAPWLKVLLGVVVVGVIVTVAVLGTQGERFKGELTWGRKTSVSEVRINVINELPDIQGNLYGYNKDPLAPGTTDNLLLAFNVEYFEGKSGSIYLDNLVLELSGCVYNEKAELFTYDEWYLAGPSKAKDKNKDWEISKDEFENGLGLRLDKGVPVTLIIDTFIGVACQQGDSFKVTLDSANAGKTNARISNPYDTSVYFPSIPFAPLAPVYKKEPLQMVIQ